MTVSINTHMEAEYKFKRLILLLAEYGYSWAKVYPLKEGSLYMMSAFPAWLPTLDPTLYRLLNNLTIAGSSMGTGTHCGRELKTGIWKVFRYPIVLKPAIYDLDSIPPLEIPPELTVHDLSLTWRT